jgi:argininosuccinate lyase
VARASAAVVGQPWRVDDAELRVMLDPRALVGSRTALGGAAPGAMRPMITRVRQHAAQLRTQARTRRDAIRAAEDILRDRASKLAGH